MGVVVALEPRLAAQEKKYGEGRWADTDARGAG